MEPKNPTLNFELLHDFALAAERLRILATPTAIEVVRVLVISEKQPGKAEAMKHILFKDRSIRRTMKVMCKVGLLRWQPWTSDGKLSLTRTTKRILRAGGCNA